MKHEKGKKNRHMVNLSPYGAALLGDRKARIDKQRAKLGKPDITYSALVEAALENMTIEMGVNK
ncbi:MAG TPA: hypothetical protein VL946_14610 [Lacibacter sp.]|nr:hypothetical protein [Lacibacter sp.]